MSGMFLDAESLASKWGFQDGDMPEEFYEWLIAAGISTEMDWHRVLVQLVRDRLLPLLPDVQVYEIETSHNPIRATQETWDSAYASGVSVIVDWADVLATAREVSA